VVSIIRPDYRVPVRLRCPLSVIGVIGRKGNNTW
jgi:hypothetical protein